VRCLRFDLLEDAGKLHVFDSKLYIAFPFPSVFAEAVADVGRMLLKLFPVATLSECDGEEWLGVCLLEMEAQMIIF
jgi:hypothetical protein